jgi:hypothetical protein
VDERRQLPIWQVMAAALALFLSGAIGSAPALAALTDTPPAPGLAQPWDDEDENDGNDAHPAGGGHHDHDDDDDDHDDHDDDDDGLELDDLLENLADVLEEVADLLDDLL